jgi:uncharacterized membrane protein YjjB (DUF3815 family)
LASFGTGRAAKTQNAHALKQLLRTIVAVAASLFLCAVFAPLASHIKHAHPLLALLAVFGPLVPGVLAIVTDLFLFHLHLRRAKRKQESQFPQVKF